MNGRIHAKPLWRRLDHPGREGVRLGPFLLTVEEASVGYRADLNLWRDGATVCVLGFYASREEAKNRSVPSAFG